MRDDLDFDEASLKPKSGKLAIIVLIALAVVGVVVAVGLLTRPPSGDPLRVAIVLKGGVNEHYDARLLDSFLEGLDAFGFTGEVVEGVSSFDDESLRGVAVEQDADHALLFELGVTRQRDSFTSDAGLFRGELAVRLVPLDPAREPRASSRVFAFERNTALDVANRVADTWRDALFPDVLGWLYESPGLEGILKGDVSIGVLEATEALRERENAFRERARRVDGYAEFCAAELDELAAMTGTDERPVSCAGDPCGQSTAVGVSADGSHAIVQDTSRHFMAEVPWSGPNWSEPPETVVELSLDEPGAAPRPVFATANILGFTDASDDGRFISTTGFTAQGSLAVATLDVAASSADSTEGWVDGFVLGGRLRASHTIPAPDGQLTLARIYDRGSRYNEPTWQVVRGLDRLELPLFEGSAATWLSSDDDGYRVAGELYDGSLAVVGFSSLEGEPDVTSVMLPGRLTHVLGEHDGELFVIWQTGYTCELGAVDLNPDLHPDDSTVDPPIALPTDPSTQPAIAAPTTQPTTAEMVAEPDALGPSGARVTSRAVLPDCIDTPSLLPDGRLIGLAYATSEGDAPGDPEVVLIDTTRLVFRLASDQPSFEMVEALPDDVVIPLTDGAYVEESPLVSADGSRVVFSRRLDDWPRDYDLNIYRRIVCWADVPPAAQP